MNADWYLNEDFWRNFGSLMFNDASFARGAQEVQNLLKLLGHSPAKVLDLGCGPGRHTLPLARAGLQVTAVDTSQTLLDQLQDRSGKLAIEIVKADMREFRRRHAFDLIVVMWTSFGYFENETDHALVLEHIRSNLKPDGRLVLDLVGLEYLCRHLQPVHLTEYDDGRILVERPDLIDNMRRLDNEWLLIDGDRVFRHHFSHRVWSAGEISCLLEICGLTVDAIFGGLEGEAFDFDAERLIVVASPACG